MSSREGPANVIGLVRRPHGVGVGGVRVGACAARRADGHAGRGSRRACPTRAGWRSPSHAAAAAADGERGGEARRVPDLLRASVQGADGGIPQRERAAHVGALLQPRGGSGVAPLRQRDLPAHARARGVGAARARRAGGPAWVVPRRGPGWGRPPLAPRGGRVPQGTAARRQRRPRCRRRAPPPSPPPHHRRPRRRRITAALAAAASPPSRSAVVAAP